MCEATPGGVLTIAELAERWGVSEEEILGTHNGRLTMQDLLGEFPPTPEQMARAKAIPRESLRRLASLADPRSLPSRKREGGEGDV